MGASQALRGPRYDARARDRTVVRNAVSSSRCVVHSFLTASLAALLGSFVWTTETTLFVSPFAVMPMTTIVLSGHWRRTVFGEVAVRTVVLTPFSQRRRTVSLA